MNVYDVQRQANDDDNDQRMRVFYELRQKMNSFLWHFLKWSTWNDAMMCVPYDIIKFVFFPFFTMRFFQMLKNMAFKKIMMTTLVICQRMVDIFDLI